MTTIPALLDHIVFAGPDLAEAVDAFEQATGVQPTPGGQHPGGTENALVAFTVAGKRGPHYLEIIGPAPAAGIPASEIATFGINTRTKPGIATFAIHPENIEQAAAAASAAGVNVGEIRPLSRRKPDGELLQWRLTRSENQADRSVPFLIDWGATAQPGLGDLPTVELKGVRVFHPQADELRRAYGVLGLDIEIDEAPAFRIEATVEGERGTVVLQ